MMRDIIFALALAKTWKECVDDINKKISCNVDKGTYTITSNQKLSTSGSKGVNLTADAGVILDGTKELAGLTWNDCSDPKTNNPHYDQRCSPGVHVASVHGRSPAYIAVSVLLFLSRKLHGTIKEIRH